MYIIGDSNCARRVHMWEQVTDILRIRDQIGPSLQLRCPRHNNAEMYVTNPDDFGLVSPEGGCREPCSLRRDCGHNCDLMCHAESLHQTIPCQRLCSKVHPGCGHPCPKLCSAPCGQCTVAIKKVRLPCGHIIESVPCWATGDLANSSIKCWKPVIRTLEPCGHTRETLCGDDPSDVKCLTKCEGNLLCGHRCGGYCHECPLDQHRERRHKPCNQPCGIKYKICSHQCLQACHPGTDCSACQATCELRCSHGPCQGKCGQSCNPCFEPCGWRCPHQGQCNMFCIAPCNRLPCDYRCDLKLDCGHQCPSICGEPCPPSRYCQVCAEPEIKVQFMCDIISQAYDDIDLDETPVVIFPCGHFFTRAFTDTLFQIESCYWRNEQGEFHHVISSVDMNVIIPSCSICGMQLSGVHRYNRIVKRAVANLMLKTFISQSHAKYGTVLGELESFEMGTAESRQKALDKIHRIKSEKHRLPATVQNLGVVTTRLDSFNDMRQKIRAFQGEVNRNTYLHMRLHQVTSPNARDPPDMDMDPHTLQGPGLSAPDPNYRLLADVLMLRLEAFSIHDHMDFLNRLISAGCQDIGKESFTKVIDDCQSYAKTADSHKRSCESTSQHRLALEFLLLQLQFISVEIHASEVILIHPKTTQLRQLGASIVLECQSLLEKYPSCDLYKAAVDQARDQFSCSRRFAISLDVRRSIDRTMQAELSSIGHLQQCLNSPTVQLLQIGYCRLISHSSRPGRAETTCLRQAVQRVGGGEPDRMTAEGVSRDRRGNMVIRSRNYR